MCLYASRNNTKKLEKRFDSTRSGWLKMYKVVECFKLPGGTFELRSIYQRWKLWYVGKHNCSLTGVKDVFTYRYNRLGLTAESSRPLKRLPYYGKNMIYKAIHVYINKTRIKVWVQSVFNNLVILPVWVHKRDLIAVGVATGVYAAFLNVTVRKNDYDKALKEGIKKLKNRGW